MTDWRCILVHDHAKVEGYNHIFEPDLWPGGRHHEDWMERSNPFLAEAKDRGV